MIHSIFCSTEKVTTYACDITIVVTGITVAYAASIARKSTLKFTVRDNKWHLSLMYRNFNVDLATYMDNNCRLCL